MSKHHVLKIKSDFWNAVACGDKNFEIRNNDRGFQKGDTVSFVPTEEGVVFSGPDKFEITYVLSGWGIEKDYVVFGMKPYWEEIK